VLQGALASLPALQRRRKLRRHGVGVGARRSGGERLVAVAQAGCVRRVDGGPTWTRQRRIGCGCSGVVGGCLWRGEGAMAVVAVRCGSAAMLAGAFDMNGIQAEPQRQYCECDELSRCPGICARVSVLVYVGHISVHGFQFPVWCSCVLWS
jgi:hypothetical protein